jgi:hypothetical protein
MAGLRCPCLKRDAENAPCPPRSLDRMLASSAPLAARSCD